MTKQNIQFSFLIKINWVGADQSDPVSKPNLLNLAGYRVCVRCCKLIINPNLIICQVNACTNKSAIDKDKVCHGARNKHDKGNLCF